MKKIIISDFYPNNYSGGFAIKCFEYLKNISPENILIIVIKDEMTQGKPEDLLNYKFIEISPKKSKSFIYLSQYLNFFSSEVLEVLNNDNLDEIILFGEKSLLGYSKLETKVKTTLYIGDPYSKVLNLRLMYNLSYYKFNLRKLNYLIGVLIQNFHFIYHFNQKSSLVDELNYFGIQHTFFWKRICRFKNIILNKTSITSVYEESQHVNRENKVLIVGKLSQIENLFAQHFLSNEVLPKIINHKCFDTISVHFIGNKNGVIPDLKKIINLNNKRIKLEGFVDRIDDYWYSAKVVLVPTITTLGVRTRIFSAFGKGCIVVCHSSCKIGIPELENNINCLIGSNGVELTNHIYSVINNQKLFKKIQSGAFLTLKKLIN